MPGGSSGEAQPDRLLAGQDLVAGAIVPTGPGGGIGRRRGLKPPFPQGSTGSSPVPGTLIHNDFRTFAGLDEHYVQARCARFVHGVSSVNGARSDLQARLNVVVSD